MKKKLAFLFPGQGSQVVGMGLDLYQEYDFVREIFDMVDEVTKTNISNLCFKGPMEELTLTVNLQPAMTAVNLACLAALDKEGIQPDVIFPKRKSIWKDLNTGPGDIPGDSM